MSKNETVLQKVVSHEERKARDLEPLTVPEDVYAFRSSDKPVLFEGSDTEVCRQWCLDKILTEERLPQAIKSLMRRSNRSRQAVRRWLYGEVMPQRGDWLNWQYWLREEGCLTHELDIMPESFFQLRKHLWRGNISFKRAARRLRGTQGYLWALLNNEVSANTLEDREKLVNAIGNVHCLVADINREITEQELLDIFEIDLNLDGDFSDVSRRYRLVSESAEEKKGRQIKRQKMLTKRKAKKKI